MPPALTRLRRVGPRTRLAGTLALGQAAGRGALAGALLILVRHLPRKEFGDLALVLAMVGILATVADGGFGRLIVRDAARSNREPTAVVLELLRVRLGTLAVVVLGTGITLAVLHTPFSDVVVVLAVAYLLGEALAFGFENASVGAERPWRFVIAQSASGVVLIAGIILLTATGKATLSSTLAVLATASALKVSTHMALWRRRSQDPWPAVGRNRIIAFYREALPFLALSLLATVYYRIGVVTLYAVQGARETASYAAALRVVDAVGVLAVIAFSAMSPALSRVHRDTPGSIWVEWRGAVARCAAIVLPLAAIGAIVAPTVSRVLFGSAYEQAAAQDLRLMMPGIALMVLQALSSAVVFMANDHKDVVRLTCFNVSACVVASIALSAAFGSPGAAAALSVAELLTFVSFAILIRRRYRPGTRAQRLPRGVGPTEP